MPTPAEREILKRIRLKGAITFKEFMEVALYHPEGGYYTSKEKIWGKDGDYITNTDVSPVFARVLAKEFYRMWQLCGSPAEFHFVEAGAGRGSFTEELRSTIEERYPEFFRSLRFVCVDRAVKGEGLKDGILWLRDIDELEKGFAGIVYSCELLDALPFHRVVKREDGLRELFVSHDGGFEEVENSPSTEELEIHFVELGIELPPLTKAEVSLEAKDWIEKAGGILDRGFVLTVDYGLPASSLYMEHPCGTLHCHWRHTVNDDPYQKIGLQDITGLVDFTSIAMAGRKAGLHTTGFTTQGYYLLSLDILDELKCVLPDEKEIYEKVRHNQGIKELIMPGGMGDTLKVLVQHKGVENPILQGFSIKDMKDRL